MQRDWLKLLYLKGVSVQQKRALINGLRSPQRVFEADPETLAQLTSVNEKIIERVVKSVQNNAFIDDKVDQLNAIGATYIGFNQGAFPYLLNQIPSPPLGLFIKGRHELLKTPQIAMVGSRNPSPSGRRTTLAFARELCEAGVTVTSGMACGIDSDAHQGSLMHNGNTVAVVGTGLDVIYPRSNVNLFHELEEKSAIVSEYPLGATPKKAHFPQRNRIISGLSLGTLVMEAGMRSGSLITARLAAEQGREVFAVPGSIHVPTSRGCHYLIHQGAKLVETVDDIFDEIGQYFVPTAREKTDTRESATTKWVPDLFRLIDYTPVSMDQLLQQSGLTVDEISSILVDLELQGLIVETFSGYQRLPD